MTVNLEKGSHSFLPALDSRCRDRALSWSRAFLGVILAHAADCFRKGGDYSIIDPHTACLILAGVSRDVMGAAIQAEKEGNAPLKGDGPWAWGDVQLCLLAGEVIKLELVSRQKAGEHPYRKDGTLP